ncbi:hypothetical protein [Aquihabitans sp. G128]|uniref:hypothetical protein n=1 Tax=Aquihabitans sp. G128 TaxID=2849779 RepID=UPI0020B17FAD|nr:hypothetical protein [Aquihabitans sp. G128]
MLAWVALVTVASLVGIPFRIDWKLKAPPFAGAVDLPFLPAVPVVLGLGLVLAARLPGWCVRLGWRRLLLTAALVGLAWGGALALVRGPSGLDRGLDGRFEYPAVVAQVDDIGLGRFVDTFTEPTVLERYPIHVQGHPLGAALLFVGLDRVGLGGAAGAAAFLLVAGAAATPAVLLAVRDVAGERRARQAAPFLVLAPAVLWTVTSADALYASVGAWAVALLVLASSPGRALGRRAVLAVAGGVLFGLGVNLSYGLAPLVLVPIVVIAVRRRWSVLAGAALGGAAVLAAFAAAGFWWFDGLAATHVRYLAGVGARRSFAYFAPLGNPAALAVAAGPAMALGLARVRDRKLWLLAGGALAAVVVADLTGLSKAEVERIWLPFVPWLLVLAAGLADRSDRPGRGSDASHDPTAVTAAEPTTVAAWSPLASQALVLQVVVAVLAESVVKTLW